MNILKIGWDHKQSSTVFRDRIVLSPENLKYMLNALLDKEARAIREATALMTCNRVEWYILTPDPEEAMVRLLDYYRDNFDFNFSSSDPRPDVRLDDEAVMHLYRVASGLESLMIGENQIQAQVRTAYELLLELREKSPVLNRLFQEALHTGKRVREETDIAKGAVSVSMAAVEMSKRIFSDFSEKTVLMVGAGESSELAVKHFQTLNVKEFIIANRSFERGEALARTCEGRHIPLHELESALPTADIIVTVTSAGKILLSAEMMKRSMKVRRNSFTYLADISSPRNIEASVAQLPNCFLVDMDTLDSVVTENLNKRKDAIEAAEWITKETAADFLSWLKTLDVIPTISSLANYFDGIRKQILSEYEHKSSEEDLKQMDEVTKRIVKRILHNPIKYLRDRAGSDAVDHREISTIWEIFKLEKMLEKYQLTK